MNCDIDGGGKEGVRCRRRVLVAAGCGGGMADWPGEAGRESDMVREDLYSER